MKPQNPSQNTAPALDLEPIRTLISDGRCDEAFERISQTMVTNPDSDSFVLWIECATSVTDANQVLATAREIRWQRNKDLWGSCCLANALIDVGCHNEAKELIRPFDTEEELSTYQLLWIRYCLKSDAQLLEKLLALKPNDPSLLAIKAYLFFKTLETRYQEADAREGGKVAGQCIGYALNQNPNCFPALFVKLFIELEFGFFENKDDFEADLRRMERISSNNFFTSYVSGWYLLNELRDFRSAIAKFDKAINDPRAQNSKSLTGLLFLGRTECYLQLNYFQSARTNVNNCLRLIPNNPVALGIRGDLFAVEKNYQDALKDYTQGLLGSPEYTVCVMGRAYCLAETSQFEEAAKCFRKAAEQNLADAQNELGLCYENGKGVEKDFSEAVKWYRKAAEQGHHGAQFQYGLCLQDGRGIPKDLEEATYWLREAASAGHPEAMSKV